MNEILTINILASDDYDKQSLPLILEAFEAGGHEVHLKSVEASPQPPELLDCDVFIDRSPLIDPAFYNSLALGYFKQRALEKKSVPLMVDNPFATMVSFDKRKTHRLFPDLIPETHNLDGTNNAEVIGRLMDDEYVVIKDPFGWYSKGVDRLSPQDAIAKYASAADLVVQKYIPFSRGLGRIYTLNYDADFEVMCSYLEIPNIWRSGEGATSSYELVDVDRELYEFAMRVSKTSGLHLNAIDYIAQDGKYILLEINAVPNLYAPSRNVGADSFGLFVKHVEKSAARHALKVTKTWR
jgi:glutathione synthase/RimK-type ligase-like ATP-grasp enzyme